MSCMIMFCTPDDVMLRNFRLELLYQPGTWSIMSEQPATGQQGLQLIHMEDESRVQVDFTHQHFAGVFPTAFLKSLNVRPTPGKLRLL